MNLSSIEHPTELHLGQGAVELAGVLTARHGKRALLVTSRGVPHFLPLFEKIRQLLAAAKVECVHFNRVPPNPDTGTVVAATKMARDFGADVLIGLGGGSAIDTAKCAAVELAYGKPCWSFRLGGECAIGPETLPVIAIPTTSGTGSEATNVAVVTNTEENYKSILISEHLFPKVALVDPSLAQSLSPALTAAVGFDAFAHCFEAYVSVNSTPMSDRCALEGMRRVAASLVKAVNAPTPEARLDMSVAATLGGMAISRAGVTLPHGMGMAIGGFCHELSHGASMAAVYPEILRQSVREGGEKYATVARIFDPSLGAGANEALPGIVASLLDSIGLGMRLSSCGIVRDTLPAIAHASVEQPGWQFHPKIHTEGDMLSILFACL